MTLEKEQQELFNIMQKQIINTCMLMMNQQNSQNLCILILTIKTDGLY